MNIEDIASGWEEPQIGQTGYYEDEFNEVKSFEITEETIEFAHKLYENDNFFSTLEAAENTVRADNVLRRLRHYAISHRATDQSMAEGGYTIGYNYQDQCLEISATGQWLTLGELINFCQKKLQNLLRLHQIRRAMMKILRLLLQLQE